MGKKTKYTIHNSSGGHLGVTYWNLEKAKEFCDLMLFDCMVCESYYARSPWRPWDSKLVEHGKEVYRNYKK